MTESVQKAFIQKQRGEFANINTLTAYIGFRDKSFDVRTFEYEELEALELDDESVVSGGIPVVLAALARLGITAPELAYVPEELARFAGRCVWTATIGEVRELVAGGGVVFVKPTPSDPKLFTGRVLVAFRDLIETASLDARQVVVCSDPVDFVSEYRAFVLRAELVGLRHYTGDFRVFPDVTIINGAVAAYETAPAAHSLDFGVTADGQTLLVEVNDAYALGCYGLAPSLYTDMLEARWAELIRTRPTRP